MGGYYNNNPPQLCSRSLRSCNGTGIVDVCARSLINLPSPRCGAAQQAEDKVFWENASLKHKLGESGRPFPGEEIGVLPLS